MIVELWWPLLALKCTAKQHAVPLVWKLQHPGTQPGPTREISRSSCMRVQTSRESQEKGTSPKTLRLALTACLSERHQQEMLGLAVSVLGWCWASSAAVHC